MSETVDLKPAPPVEDDELIENLARFADGTLTEKQVKSRHRLSNKDWRTMGESNELVELVEAAKLRRIRTGATKRERAQLEIVDGPPILGKLMRDPNTNARHVIDSVRALDALASNGAEAAAAGARFEITINLGGDHIEHYSKSIEINADDTPPNAGKHTPQRSLPVADKPWDESDCAPVKTIKRRETGKAERAPEDIERSRLIWGDDDIDTADVIAAIATKKPPGGGDGGHI